MTTLPARTAPRHADVRLDGSTLGEALRAIAAVAPQATVTFPELKAALTTAELLALAERCAGALVAEGVRPGEIVGILAPTGPGLLAGVFGVALAGAAATVLPLPAGVGGSERHISQIVRITDAAAMRHIVVDAPSVQHAGQLLRSRPGLTVVPTMPSMAKGGALPLVGPDDLAVVQFTSGTTTLPRGVMLPHRAVLAALRSILISAEHTPSDVLVHWMPYHHDMGLFGHLSQLLNGADSHVFDPITLIRRPSLLLLYMASIHASVLTGVNFAYEMLLDAATPQVLDGLDLSAWRLAYNGAEPVSAATVRRFARVLGPAGVGEGVMFPVYGLAEATLPVTFPQPGSAPRLITFDRDVLGTEGRVEAVPSGHQRAKTAVSVGTPVAGMQVRLVDEYGALVQPGCLGDVQIKGDMVTRGYLRDRDATSALFDGAWLRTGDLGFKDGGDYFVVGRRKEMAIIRGQNYFPDDAEAVARTTPGVHRQRAVAVARSDGDGPEHIAVIAETALTGPSRDRLAEEIRQRVCTEMALPDIRVHLVEPRWLTRTTSGKWQRLQAAAHLEDRSTA